MNSISGCPASSRRNLPYKLFAQRLCVASKPAVRDKSLNIFLKKYKAARRNIAPASRPVAAASILRLFSLLDGSYSVASQLVLRLGPVALGGSAVGSALAAACAVVSAFGSAVGGDVLVAGNGLDVSWTLRAAGSRAGCWRRRAAHRRPVRRGGGRQSRFEEVEPVITAVARTGVYAPGMDCPGRNRAVACGASDSYLTHTASDAQPRSGGGSATGIKASELLIQLLGEVCRCCRILRQIVRSFLP